MPKFCVRLYEVVEGEVKEISTDAVTSLREGEDVAQAILDVFAEAFQPGLRIISVPGGRVYEAAEREGQHVQK